jgi:hypothetical protein
VRGNKFDGGLFGQLVSDLPIRLNEDFIRSHVIVDESGEHIRA